MTFHCGFAYFFPNRFGVWCGFQFALTDYGQVDERPTLRRRGRTLKNTLRILGMAERLPNFRAQNKLIELAIEATSLAPIRLFRSCRKKLRPLLTTTWLCAMGKILRMTLFVRGSPKIGITITCRLRYRSIATTISILVCRLIAVPHWWVTCFISASPESTAICISIGSP
jgi:hypothetical protein